jgi:hypothetical protein
VALNITVLITFFASMFGYCWDIYVDFGLCRTLAPGKAFLRSKLLYPKWFYYFAMISNLFMRLTWVIPYFNKSLPMWLLDHQADQYFLLSVEVLRRAQWALLRLENENCNNFEQYRNVLQIPEFDDDIAVINYKAKKGH